MSARIGLGAVFLWAALVPGAARAQQADDVERLRSLRDRLASLQARAQSGEIGVLADPSGSGTPAWLVVDPDDVRGQLAALHVSGEIDAAEMTRRGEAIRRDLAAGLERLGATLADLEARIRSSEAGARGIPPAAGGPPPPPAPPAGEPAGRKEVWRVLLTGVGGAGEARALSSLEGRLDLVVAADGSASGRVTWEGRGVSDPAVEGTVHERRVLLRFDAPDGTGQTLFTGVVDASGRHVNGRYRITSGSTVVSQGSWRATRE